VWRQATTVFPYGAPHVRNPVTQCRHPDREHR